MNAEMYSNDRDQQALPHAIAISGGRKVFFDAALRHGRKAEAC
jgi:hypothetical protein